MKETLDSRQLKAFAVLAETGSYTETAKRLYVTHSAISHTINALETQLGCRLFSKLRKKTVLTEAGESLLHHADRVFKEMRQAHLTLAELNRKGPRRLRMAADAVLLSNFLAPVLLKLHEEFPRVALHVEACGPAEAVRCLENNRADVALSAKPPADNFIEFIPLFADRFHFVVRAGHPLISMNAVPRAELSNYPCALLFGSGHDGEWIKNSLLRFSIALNVTAEVESWEIVKNMMMETDMVTFVPRWIVAAELERQSLVALPMGKKILEQTWGLIHPKDRPLNPSEAGLLKLCRKHVAKFA